MAARCASRAVLSGLSSPPSRTRRPRDRLGRRRSRLRQGGARMRQGYRSGIACMMLAIALLGPRPAGAAETIRIGYLGPLTGIFAQDGMDMLAMLTLWLD